MTNGTPIHPFTRSTMKQLLIFSLLGFLTLPACAQTWKQNRPISGVNALKASAGVDVFVRQGNTESLTLDVKGFDEDEVIASVRNGQLTISRERGNWFGGSPGMGTNRYIRAYLTVRQLSAIDVSSGADLKGETAFETEKLAIHVSSGADLELTVKTRTLDVQVSSGADANLTGSTGKLAAQVSGGANLNADRLLADVCYAQASGGADARVYGGKELYLQASGGADVNYRGPGRVMAKQESGGGDVNQN